MTNKSNQSKHKTDNTPDRDSFLKNLNLSGLFWGLLIIVAGVLLLLDNIGALNISLGQIWRLWPLAIVGIGISILPLKSRQSTIASGVFALFALITFIYVITTEPKPVTDTTRQSISVSQPTETIESNKIDVNLSAGTLQLNSSGSVDLVDADLISNGFTLHQSEATLDNSHTVKIRTDGEPSVWPLSLSNFRNELTVNLAEDRQLDLAIDAGAAKVRGDLSRVTLRSLEIDTGASNTSLKLGDTVSVLDVSIKTGASSIALEIPRSSGVRVEVKGGLSSKDFEGLDEVSEDVYETSDYNQAEYKVVISADIGVSSLKIARY